MIDALIQHARSLVWRALTGLTPSDALDVDLDASDVVPPRETSGARPGPPLEVIASTGVAACAEAEEDFMAVQTVDVNAPGMGRCVRVTVVADDTPSVVVLRPSHARAMSAAMLNAADLADGTTPLQFTPAEVAS